MLQFVPPKNHFQFFQAGQEGARSGDLGRHRVEEEVVGETWLTDEINGAVARVLPNV